MNLEQLQAEWVNTPEYHKHINEMFCQLVDKDPELKSHRDFVQNNIWGTGERSFWWLWMLLIAELPENPKLLEIGCLKGATLSVWKHLAPDAHVFGVTPLDTTGGVWDDDYLTSIQTIHNKFNNGEMPFLFVGLSEDEKIINSVKKIAPFNLVYIDGGHERRHIDNDLKYYAPMVSMGGYLVIDDACCDMKMPWGYFQGIQPVTDGVIDFMVNNKNWEFITNVVHLRIYKRI